MHTGFLLAKLERKRPLRRPWRRRRDNIEVVLQDRRVMDLSGSGKG